MTETTVCSSMHCRNYAAKTDNPAKPPFCDECKEKVAKQTQKAEA